VKPYPPSRILRRGWMRAGYASPNAHDFVVAPGNPSYEFDMVRVILPPHLKNLAQVRGDVELEVVAPITQRSVLDALEARYPMLRGTIRDHGTQIRRPFLRFFACEEDLSHESPDAPLPDTVAAGMEPLIILGAIAGG
jgi:molybdopterin synthase sulfur carrier subunit